MKIIVGKISVKQEVLDLRFLCMDSTPSYITLLIHMYYNIPSGF